MALPPKSKKSDLLSVSNSSLILSCNMAVKHKAKRLTDIIDICYKPDSYMTPEQREVKLEAFKRGYVTVSLLLNIVALSCSQILTRFVYLSSSPMILPTLSSSASKRPSGIRTCRTALPFLVRRPRRPSDFCPIKGIGCNVIGPRGTSAHIVGLP